MSVSINKSINKSLMSDELRSRDPSDETLRLLFTMSQTNDMPIHADYWLDSQAMNGKSTKAFIGIRTDKTKLLVKSSEEYTSPITKVFKSGNEFIILSENSIYVVDAKISQKLLT